MSNENKGLKGCNIRYGPNISPAEALEAHRRLAKEHYGKVRAIAREKNRFTIEQQLALAEMHAESMDSLMAVAAAFNAALMGPRQLFVPEPAMMAPSTTDGRTMSGGEDAPFAEHVGKTREEYTRPEGDLFDGDTANEVEEARR